MARSVVLRPVRLHVLAALVLVASCGSAVASEPIEPTAQAPTIAPAGGPPPPVAPGAPPSEGRLGPPHAWPCLPARLDALLVAGRVRQALLLDPSSNPNAVSARAYYLVARGDRPRLALLASDGSVVDASRATALGVPGSGALVRVELAPDGLGCDSPSVRIVSARRLDATPSLRVDVGATIDALVEGYERATPERAAVETRARRAVDGSVAAEAAAASATPRGVRSTLGYMPAWSESERTLSVLVVVRSERTLEEIQASRDPHAGSFWCDAPPGADCAPQCVPPSWRVVHTFVGEAGVTAEYGEDGARLRLIEEPEGAFRPRVRRREGIGDCRR